MKVSAGKHPYEAAEYKILDAYTGEVIDLESNTDVVKSLVNKLALLSYKLVIAFHASTYY